MAVLGDALVPAHVIHGGGVGHASLGVVCRRGLRERGVVAVVGGNCRHVVRWFGGVDFLCQKTPLALDNLLSKSVLPLKLKNSLHGFLISESDEGHSPGLLSLSVAEDLHSLYPPVLREIFFEVLLKNILAKPSYIDLAELNLLAALLILVAVEEDADFKLR